MRPDVGGVVADADRDFVGAGGGHARALPAVDGACGDAEALGELAHGLPADGAVQVLEGVAAAVDVTAGRNFWCGAVAGGVATRSRVIAAFMGLRAGLGRGAGDSPTARHCRGGNVVVR